MGAKPDARSSRKAFVRSSRLPPLQLRRCRRRKGLDMGRATERRRRATSREFETCRHWSVAARRLLTMPRLLLASRRIPGLSSLLGARGRQAVLVPTAANPLAEIADEVERELAAAGLDVE